MRLVSALEPIIARALLYYRKSSAGRVAGKMEMPLLINKRAFLLPTSICLRE